MPATQEAAQRPARSTREERAGFLHEWALQNPLGTIEEARQALRAHFGGIAMGTKAIADTLREAKKLYEAEFRARKGLQAPTAAPETTQPAPLQTQINAWADGMRRAGIRSITLQEGGRVQVEFG